MGGRNHGHLALVMNPTQYLTLSGGVPFIPPRNLVPDPIPPMMFMMATQMELFRQQHQAKLLAFHMCNNTNTALKNQLIAAVDDMYFSSIKQTGHVERCWHIYIPFMATLQAPCYETWQINV
eukprot:10403699-Ditylum_brightwellii.AAC.1